MTDCVFINRFLIRGFCFAATPFADVDLNTRGGSLSWERLAAAALSRVMEFFKTGKLPFVSCQW